MATNRGLSPQLGLSSIFDSEKADLSGISKEPGLYVEELVQMVSFQVDADYSRSNFLTGAYPYLLEMGFLQKW